MSKARKADQHQVELWRKRRLRSGSRFKFHKAGKEEAIQSINRKLKLKKR